MTEEEWSIRDVARTSGTTSRTLRHYEAVGLLRPSRVGAGGRRYYDRHGLLRLQQILVLRRLEVPLAEVTRMLDDAEDPPGALRDHLARLRAEQRVLARMVTSVERTLRVLEEGGALVAQEMFDGFDHTRHKDEVEERWGADAYAAGDAWWRGMTREERSGWGDHAARLATAWTTAARSGVAPEGPEAQDLARRHAAWLAEIPGTPGHGTGQVPAAYLVGLGDMYVADPRFAASYGGVDGARFVRDALRAYVGEGG